MTHVTYRLTAKNRDHLRNSTLGSRVWATFFNNDRIRYVRSANSFALILQSRHHDANESVKPMLCAYNKISQFTLIKVHIRSPRYLRGLVALTGVVVRALDLRLKRSRV